MKIIYAILLLLRMTEQSVFESEKKDVGGALPALFLFLNNFLLGKRFINTCAL